MVLPPRSRRWLIGVGVALLVFTVVGFFVAPLIVKSQLEKRASELLGRKVTVGKVRLNPYALSVTLEDFNIQRKDDLGSFIGWQRLYVNFDALSSLWGEWVLSDVELTGFHGAVVINPDGSLSFADLIARLVPPTSAQAAPAKPARPVRIGLLNVQQARFEFFDQSRKLPFKAALGPITFVAREFRTAGSRGAPSQFEAFAEAGERIAWQGTVSVDPLASTGDFTLENIVLKNFMPYLEDRLQADVTDGKLTVKGHYDVAFGANHRALRLTDGEVHVRNFKLADRATGTTALDYGSLDVTGLLADALELKAVVGRVAVSDGHVVARRGADGTINLLAMLQPPPGPAPAAGPASAPAATPAELPSVKVGEVAVKNFRIDVTDESAPRPATLALDHVQFSLKDFTLAPGASMPLDLAFDWQPKGTVHVSGHATLKPVISADLRADVSALEILPLSPYLEQFVNARITGGAVTTSLALTARLGEGAPQATAEGDVSVQKFGLVDSAHNEDLAGFGELKLTGLKAATAPELNVAIGEIAVNAPTAHVLVNADKSINLLSVMKAPAASPAPAPAAPAPAAPPPKISIGKVTIADGEFTYADRSLEPNVHMAINQFGGAITGLSSENLARADVDLKGLVDGAGPVAIVGKLDPLGPRKFVDLKVDFKNVDLLPVSPYVGKFAGYELARGKLVVDTKVNVDGDALDSTNVVTLQQFTFGAATNSPDATGLPVRLGVALLKDLDGKILIDLPVQGRIGDPNFRIGKVVVRVIVNLLTKVATSPFALLGSMFGGGGDELAYQEFSPGHDALLPTEIPKLDTMIKALTNRPGLSLAIEGGYDQAADTYALKRSKEADLVRRQIWEERHAKDPNIPPPAELVITPEEDAAMVKKLFDEKFPPGTKFGAPVAAAPVPTAAPPPPKPGMFRRVVNALTFRSKSAAAPAVPAETKPAAAATEAAPGIPLEEMTSRLAETMPVDENDLRALAAARAQRVRDHFINVGHIAADRLFLSQGAAAKADKGPRVFLSLQ